MVNVIIEAVGFLFIVWALAAVYLPLGVAALGVGLIVVANRPPAAEQGSADADSPTLP